MAGEADTGTESAGYGGPDLFGCEATGDSGVVEGGADVIVYEMPAANELAECEGRPVEGVVAAARAGGANAS